MPLAADYCPQRAEGFAFASLMSIINLAAASTNNVGWFLYIHIFHNNLKPLRYGQLLQIVVRLRLQFFGPSWP